MEGQQATIETDLRFSLVPEWVLDAKGRWHALTFQSKRMLLVI